MTSGNDVAGHVTAAIKQHTNHLRQRNGGLEAMNYYYDRADGLYGERVEELKAAKEEGKKIVGTFCNFVPSELIRAAGAVPLRLCGGYEGVIATAEKKLPRIYCPLIKSSVGLMEESSPHFDLLDVAVCPTTCDGKKKLAELMGQHKQTWVLEVPHTVDTPQGREFWLVNLKLLKKQLETLTGNRITKKNLKAEINTYNHMRKLVHRLYETRKQKKVPIWGGDVLLVTSLALYDEPRQWITATENLCSVLEKRDNGGIDLEEHSRLLLTGTPMILPAWKLVRIIETVGGVIVCDDICTGSKPFWDPVTPMYSTKEDMLIAIADKYLMNTCPCFVPNKARLDRIMQYVKDFKIEGVVNYVLQSCHPYGAEEWRVKEAVKNAGVPVYSIDTDYGEGDTGQIKIRMEAFMEMVKAKRDEAGLF